jgi:hypothetical protein
LEIVDVTVVDESFVLVVVVVLNVLDVLVVFTVLVLIVLFVDESFAKKSNYFKLN